MGVVKILAMVFLAIYLILVGVISLTGIALPMVAKVVFDLIPIASGIFIFISLGTCCGKGGSHEPR